MANCSSESAFLNVIDDEGVTHVVQVAADNITLSMEAQQKKGWPAVVKKVPWEVSHPEKQIDMSQANSPETTVFLDRIEYRFVTRPSVKGIQTCTPSTRIDHRQLDIGFADTAMGAIRTLVSGQRDGLRAVRWKGAHNMVRGLLDRTFVLNIPRDADVLYGFWVNVVPTHFDDLSLVAVDSVGETVALCHWRGGFDLPVWLSTGYYEISDDGIPLAAFGDIKLQLRMTVNNEGDGVYGDSVRVTLDKAVLATSIRSSIAAGVTMRLRNSEIVLTDLATARYLTEDKFCGGNNTRQSVAFLRPGEVTIVERRNVEVGDDEET